jgi:hypothetical protein
MDIKIYLQQATNKLAGMPMAFASCGIYLELSHTTSSG